MSALGEGGGWADLGSAWVSEKVVMLDDADLRGLTYAQQLRHPLWQRRRLEVLQRADFTCERCGSTSTELHAHHKTYIRGRMAWQYPDDLLECLCDPCHDIAHAHKQRLAIQVARRPSSELPILSRIFSNLAEAMDAGGEYQRRVDALNRVQDELDAAEDYRRGAGNAETAA
jgi:hypothetical protein